MGDSTAGVDRPSAARLQLAQELRRLRDVVGLTTREVAGEAQLSQSKVTRAEHVTYKVEVSTVTRLCAFYGVDQDVTAELCSLAVADAGEGAWLVRAGGTGRRQRQGATLEQIAVKIRQYQPMLVPGIFQVSAYVRGVLANLGEPADPEVVIAGRRRRQAMLSAPTGPQYDVILTEHAVTSRYAPPAALAEQLDHLASFGGHQRISVRVIPAEAVRTAMSTVPFMYFTFRSSPSTVYLETPTVDLYVAAPDDVARYAAMFERLTDDALGRAETSELLVRLASRFR